ncbi:MAG: hypothetical protein WC728_00400 [Elusimicrobiota bacterium]
MKMIAIALLLAAFRMDGFCAEFQPIGLTQGLADLAPTVSADLEALAKSYGLDPKSPTLTKDLQKLIETTAMPGMQAAMYKDLQRLGLAPNASWREIAAKGQELYKQKGKDELLALAAGKLDMDPKTATWKGVVNEFGDRARRTVAKKMDLGSDASWVDIHKAFAKKVENGEIKLPPPVKIKLPGK